MKNTPRKGQLEIMGLIVIVVLLTLGMFFVIITRLNSSPDNSQQQFSDNQMASRFVISFLKSTSDCQNYDMEDLIQDCAKSMDISCNGNTSCQIVNSTLDSYLNNTFEVYNTNYNMSISGLPIDVQFGQGCGEFSEREHSYQPISLYPYPGTVEVNLDICRG